MYLHLYLQLSNPSFPLASYRAYLSLHSFPTRRSSDLHRSPTGSRSWATARTATPVCPAGVRKDRKSTRLNSSHVAISYAVFCLKKKIALAVKAHVDAVVEAG